ncbi:hypothetical protein ABZ404_39075, partial [Streptomyces sp. NPDC005878]|uniref:hypothetical protein n=1 Tax=Streptomyces sp. NPDC005878 TaxID=3157077 RepID=UPI0033C3BFA2
GSAAAAAIALRQVGGCFEHRPVDVTSFGELDQMMCALCGRFLMPRGDEWVLADPGDPRWG